MMRLCGVVIVLAVAIVATLRPTIVKHGSNDKQLENLTASFNPTWTACLHRRAYARVWEDVAVSWVMRMNDQQINAFAVNLNFRHVDTYNRCCAQNNRLDNTQIWVEGNGEEPRMFLARWFFTGDYPMNENVKVFCCSEAEFNQYLRRDPTVLGIVGPNIEQQIAGFQSPCRHPYEGNHLDNPLVVPNDPDDPNNLDLHVGEENFDMDV